MSQLNECVNCGSQDFEEEDGQLVCTQCGQQKEGLLQVVDDSGDFGTQGKVSRRKIEKTKVRYARVYRGAKAYRLYLQAWQHILWKQAFALIHQLKIAPPELWTVARDLWTLTLSQLTARLDRDDPSTTSRNIHGDPTTEDQYSVDRQAEISEALTATSSFSPSLWASISHIYVSVLLLRLPISLANLYQFILTDQIPFVRAIRHVPYEMVSRLPPEYHRNLDTLSVPAKTELQQAVSDLVNTFQNNFHLAIPALNWKVTLFEWTKTLALPIEVYPASKRLIDQLRYDFTYNTHPENSSDNPNQKIKSRKTPVFWPEVQLISVLVVATKLFYPFPLPATLSDTTTRPHDTITPVSAPASMDLSWSTWLSLHRADLATTSKSKSDFQQSPLPSGEEITVRDTDVLNMSDKAIDAYMDWYQRMFTTPDAILATKKTDLEQSILNMFPISHIDLQDSFSENYDLQRQKQKQQQYTLSERVQAEALLPGGQAFTTTTTTTITSTSMSASESASASTSAEKSYPIFPTVESIEATTSLFDAETDENPVLYFHQLAADVACVDLKRLVVAVRYTEQRLERLFREKSKKKRNEAFNGGGSEENVEVDVAMD